MELKTPLHSTLTQLTLIKSDDLQHGFTKLDKAERSSAVAKIMVVIAMSNREDFDTFKKANNLDKSFASRATRCEWEIKGFRLLPHSEEREITHTRLFMEYMGNYLRISSFHDERMAGLLISAYTGRPRNDAIVFPLQPCYNSETLRRRNRKLVLRLMDVDSQGLLYFSDNETALQYHAYIKEFEHVERG